VAKVPAPYRPLVDRQACHLLRVSNPQGEAMANRAEIIDMDEWFEALAAEGKAGPYLREKWPAMDLDTRRQIRRRMDYGLTQLPLEAIASNEGGVPMCFEPIGEDLIVVAKELLALKARVAELEAHLGTPTQSPPEIRACVDKLAAEGLAMVAGEVSA